MALKSSQGACEAIAARREAKYVRSTDIAFDIDYADATYGTVDRIYNTGTVDFTSTTPNSLSFLPGNNLMVDGSTSNDITTGRIIYVSATTILLPDGTLAADESAGDDVVLIASDGGSLADIYEGGDLLVFSGTRRTHPSQAYNAGGTATLLLTWTDITFGTPSWDSINYYATIALAARGTQPATRTATAVAGGTATWCCFVRKGHSGTAESTSAIRMDGSAGTVGTDLVLSNATFSAGVAETLNTAYLRFKE